MSLLKIQKFLSKKYDLLIVAIIGGLNSFALMPSITSSLGITSLEDGPVQPSLVYKNPEFYTNDFRASEFQRLMWTTSTKWIPALMYKYLNVDPKFAHLFLTYSQTVLLLVGTFLLASSLFKSRRASYLSVAFVIIFSPYFNNFGAYGDQFFMPYGTWISIGPLLLAWAYSIKGNRKKTFIWLFIGASIHPTMAMTATITILAFKNFSDQNLKQNTKIILELLTPAIFFSAVASLIRHNAFADQVPSQWFSALKEVLHWYAWKLNPEITGNAGATVGIDYFETTAYSILLIFSSLILTQSRIFEFSSLIKENTKKLVLAFITLYAVQAVSFELNISDLFSISFGRFSIFSSIFAVIIFAYCISFLHLKKNTKLQKIVLSPLLIFCLLIPSFLNFAILGLVLVINELKQRIPNKLFLFMTTVFIISSVVFGRANYNDAWWSGPIYKFIPNALITAPNHLSLRIIEYFSFYSWPIILGIILALYSKKLAKYTSYSIVIVVISITTITLGGRYVLSERRDAVHKDWIETQLWALNNSNVNSQFIVNSGMDLYESWTTLSRRSRLIANQKAGFLYFYTKEDSLYDQRRVILPDAPNSKIALQSDLESFYINFSKNIGGDYLVWKKEHTKLPFNIVYENDKYIIYELLRNGT